MSATILPGRRLITVTRCVRHAAPNTLCVTNSVVKRCAGHGASKSAFRRWHLISSSAANGSSTKSASGRVTGARAIEIADLHAPDSSAGKLATKRSSRAAASADVTRAPILAAGSRAMRSGSATLSATLAHGISVGSGKT